MNDNFNYNLAAELYAAPASYRPKAPRYMRFPSAAEAIRYAIEVLPRAQLRHTSVEVNEERYEGDAILQLYLAPAYPLTRAST